MKRNETIYSLYEDGKISKRLYTMCCSIGFVTLGDLLRPHRNELLTHRNFGKKLIS